MHPSAHSSIVYNSQDMEAIQGSAVRCMDKEYVEYIHNGILLIHLKKKKKEWNNAICSSMDGPRDYRIK